jgi:hypothetical protein
MPFPKPFRGVFPLLLLLAGSFAFPAPPKRLANAKAMQCSTCHGADKVLPDGHPNTLAMKTGSCGDCHGTTAAASLRGKVPLGHRHALAGVTCTACHGKGRPEKVKADHCLGCHDLPKLILKTAGAKFHNPHDDQHGYAKNCNLCHHQHRKADNYCLRCHAFEWSVP